MIYQLDKKKTHFRAGLPRQQCLEYGPVSIVRVDVHVNDRPGGALLPKQIASVDRLQGTLRHSYGTETNKEKIK